MKIYTQKYIVAMSSFWTKENTLNARLIKVKNNYNYKNIKYASLKYGSFELLDSRINDVFEEEEEEEEEEDFVKDLFSNFSIFNIDLEIKSYPSKTIKFQNFIVEHITYNQFFSRDFINLFLSLDKTKVYFIFNLYKDWIHILSKFKEFNIEIIEGFEIPDNFDEHSKSERLQLLAKLWNLDTKKLI